MVTGNGLLLAFSYLCNLLEKETVANDGHGTGIDGSV